MSLPNESTATRRRLQEYAASLKSGIMSARMKNATVVVGDSQELNDRQSVGKFPSIQSQRSGGK